MGSRNTAKRVERPDAGAAKARRMSTHDVEATKQLKASLRRYALMQPRLSAAEERAAAIAGIQRGLDDGKAGRTMSLREAIHSIRAGGKSKARSGAK